MLDSARSSMAFYLRHPTAAVSREIDNIILSCAESRSFLISGICAVLARVISLTVFPVVLGLELIVKRIPKAICSFVFSREIIPEKGLSKFELHLDKVCSFFLALIFFPLGALHPDSMSAFFLRRPNSKTKVLPFGVEAIYGKKVDQIHFPKSKEEAIECVKEATNNNRRISVIGAGMSEGIQTVPNGDKGYVIHTKHLNHVTIDSEQNVAHVESGATWEQIQIQANKVGKSVIVKQASDLFSVGGSISMNAHGWAHEYGAIASVVKSITIIDAQGEIKTLFPGDELFGCFFGSLGYFGLIISAEIQLTDNEHLIEKSEAISIDHFHEHYQKFIKGQNIPLFGGRLSLDAAGEKIPLQTVEMVQYVKNTKKNEASIPPIVTANFRPELKYGRRIERIGLMATEIFSQFTVERFLSSFWRKEVKALKSERQLTRNEALHPPINAFMMLHQSNLHAQWLQEYFIKPEQLADFLKFLGQKLKDNKVRLVNATIRPTPKDEISILPYAREEDRYAVVLSFAQEKTTAAVAKTKKWIKEVHDYLFKTDGVYYQAYMPYATRKEFKQSYGTLQVRKFRDLKKKYDPTNLFGNAHTARYFDKKSKK